MFQQRHFEAIAQMMQELHPGRGLSTENRAVMQWEATRRALDYLFLQHNPRFNSQRFYNACEPGANVHKRVA